MMSAAPGETRVEKAVLSMVSRPDLCVAWARFDAIKVPVV